LRSNTRIRHDVRHPGLCPTIIDGGVTVATCIRPDVLTSSN
jgi:hypothetical protein